jgi:hypothetical protein
MCGLQVTLVQQHQYRRRERGSRQIRTFGDSSSNDLLGQPAVARSKFLAKPFDRSGSATAHVGAP